LPSDFCRLRCHLPLYGSCNSRVYPQRSTRILYQTIYRSIRDKVVNMENRGLMLAHYRIPGHVTGKSPKAFLPSPSTRRKDGSSSLDKGARPDRRTFMHRNPSERQSTTNRIETVQTDELFFIHTCSFRETSSTDRQGKLSLSASFPTRTSTFVDDEPAGRPFSSFAGPG
jgi:hypothetical protein